MVLVPDPDGTVNRASPAAMAVSTRQRSSAEAVWIGGSGTSDSARSRSTPDSARFRSTLGRGDQVAGRAGSGVAGGSSADRRERQRRSIIDGAADCLEHRGVSGTTVDDIGRAAGCSRATVYRIFPGGKEEVLAAVVETETANLLSALAVRLDCAESLGEALVEAIGGAGRWLRGHRLVRRLVDHEPDVLLPWLSFDNQGVLLAYVADWAAPFLGRWMDRGRALRLGEWAARIVLAYGIGGTPGGHFADDAWVRRLVETYILPSVQVQSSAQTESSGGERHRGRAPGAATSSVIAGGVLARDGERPWQGAAPADHGGSAEQRRRAEDPKRAGSTRSISGD